jgi:PPOX class probable F420-dependent enzyme
MPAMDEGQMRRFLSEGTRTGSVAIVRADGRPHVTPVWFVLDGDDLLFTTHGTSLKAKAIRRDARVCLCVDDQAPPYSYVMVEGDAALGDEPGELRRWATAIAARYMGDDEAERYGRRNSVEGELLVRVTPRKVVGYDGVSSFE